jgi:2-C-methyl-D-erythritol 4-phosphate cytidylyltransferase/2-C-methyl-D-erythritol 2,4-cyclodiphosphate synthase
LTLTAAIIVAAGRGTRASAADRLPKQYAEIAGRSVLARTLESFLDHPLISAIIVVIHPDDHALYAKAVDGLMVTAAVDGGATRQASVLAGLEALAELAPDYVLIHDAARPFVGTGLISRVIAALDLAPGAIAADPLADTPPLIHPFGLAFSFALGFTLLNEKFGGGHGLILETLI